MDNTMDALDLLAELEDVIDKGTSVPFTGRCMLDREELLEIIQDIRLKLPTDLEKAKWINAQRQNIINDANKEADELMKIANDKIMAMISENEITKRAMAAAEEITGKANAEAQAAKQSSYQYADYLLENVETVVHKTIRDLEQCISIVKERRDQLK